MEERAEEQAEGLAKERVEEPVVKSGAEPVAEAVEEPEEEPEEEPVAEWTDESTEAGSGPEQLPAGRIRVYEPAKDPGRGHPAAKLAVELIERVVEERGTHLLIEPLGEGCVARAIVDGRVFDLTEFPLQMGKQLVTRFKALSGMDLAKRRQRQIGSVNVILGENAIKLRLSTAADLVFENLIIRVLDPSEESGSLESLGLLEEQVNALRGLANQAQGLVLVVGPRGSGKSTTVYSLLGEVADPSRKVVTVEDPIEHRIPHAEQQEVGPEVGRRMLLQYAVNQAPDLLFLSEIRGLGSAQTCVDFTQSGHLTVSTMESSNAATAVFRLDKLGVDRSTVADVLTGVVAQRLLRRLCPECKTVKPHTAEERALLERYCQEVPEASAHPVGCAHCHGSGYQGRVGVFEVIPVDPEMADLIREDRPIGELREHAKARGDLLLGDHVLQMVRNHTITVEDAHRSVLLEEGGFTPSGAEESAEGDPPPATGETGLEPGAVPGSPDATEPGLAAPVEGVVQPLARERTILVVEDEEGTLFLIEQILAKAGYQVVTASDGAEALLLIGTRPISLILSDIHMPNLDGLKLLEILAQHDIRTPVVFLTAEPSPEIEARGREMGVADYLRKPVQRDRLLESILNVLGKDEAGKPAGPGAKPFVGTSEAGVSKKRDPRRRY
jgi:type IV pilus assembly protein PilB